MEEIKGQLIAILSRPLSEPEEIATFLQNVASARTYALEQMQDMERRLPFLQGDEKDLLQSQHQEVRRVFFELDEQAKAYSKILSYQAAVARLVR